MDEQERMTIRGSANMGFIAETRRRGETRGGRAKRGFGGFAFSRTPMAYG
jgi:hypothetical protein